MRRQVATWALVAACAACAPALRDVKRELSAADGGRLWLASAESLIRTTDGFRFVAGDPVVVSGELKLPSGALLVPAVIMAHGCNAVGNAEAGWATVLREWGYATLVLDSFRGRGLTEVCTRSRALTGTQRIPDAYGALRILVTHPGIDTRPVALR